MRKHFSLNSARKRPLGRRWENKIKISKSRKKTVNSYGSGYLLNKVTKFEVACV
jgi:hypothetical protein